MEILKFIQNRAPTMKCNPLVAPAIISAATSLFNMFSQKRTNEENIENQWALFNAQKGYQDKLNANGALLQRQSMAKAGMNLNMDNGTSPNLVASPGQMATKSAPQIDPAAMALLGDTALKLAQAKNLDADTKGKDIQNNRESSFDDYVDKMFHDKFKNDEDVTGDNVLPGVSVTSSEKHYNKGSFDAQKFFRQWESEKNKLNREDVENALAQTVADLQSKNPAIYHAMAEMPWMQRRMMNQQISNLIKDRSVMESVIKLNESSAKLNDANEEWVRFKKKLEEETNIKKIIVGMFKDGVTMDDVAKVFLLTLAEFATHGVSLGF